MRLLGFRYLPSFQPNIPYNNPEPVALQIPQIKRLGPLFVRKYFEKSFDPPWNDLSKITDNIIQGYKKPYRTNNWDKALWELTLANHPLHLEDQLSSIRVPVLVITGDNDRIIPKEESQRIARKIPKAEFVVIRNCGHLPHEERPEDFIEAVNGFLERVLS